MKLLSFTYLRFETCTRIVIYTDRVTISVSSDDEIYLFRLRINTKQAEKSSISFQVTIN